MRHRLVGIIMAGLFLLPWQVRAENLSGAETEEDIIIQDGNMVVVLARAPILKKIKRKGKNRFQVA